MSPDWQVNQILSTICIVNNLHIGVVVLHTYVSMTHSTMV